MRNLDRQCLMERPSCLPDAGDHVPHSMWNVNSRVDPSSALCTLRDDSSIVAYDGHRPVVRSCVIGHGPMEECHPYS